MSAEPADDKAASFVDRLRDALISLGRLTPENALRIDEIMRTRGLGFAGAAIHLGLLEPDELAKAAQAARRESRPSEIFAKGVLTAENIVSIDEAMRTMGLGFSEAAVHLGIVTSEELASAAHVSRPPPDGIFESALQKSIHNIGLPIKYVGTVEIGPSLMLGREPDSTYSEQIRALRTELMLLNGGSRSGNLLVVLSPSQGEGRTQLCAELAIAFSHLGQPTLLVDADLRRPRVHALFNAKNMAGLGPALASGGAPHVLNVDKLPHLSILTAGPGVSNPLELLTNGHFQRQMSDWRKKYRMIIVDTPPISEFADGLAIASFAEQVVIVGRSGSTRHQSIKEMLRRMGSTQSRIVGAVINSF